MILKGKQTHIAYRCPACGYAIFGFAGAFTQKSDLLKIKCPCGESEAAVHFASDQTVKITVPCLFCDTPHTYNVSRNVFFGQELFLLSCPYTRMDICFLGQKEKIDDALRETGEELDKLFDEYATETDDEGRDGSVPPIKDLLPDVYVYDILRFIVKELEEDGKIHCPCGEGPYEMDVTEDGVRVYCTSCGAEYTFSADSVSAAESFLSCEELRLVYTPK